MLINLLAKNLIKKGLNSMNVHTSFQVLTFVLLVWYSCLRWWWFSYASKKYPERDYSWANAPINMATAFTSIIFLSCTLFAFTQTATTWLQIFRCIGGFLAIRNIWYTIEDAYSYINQSWNTQKEQAIFVLLDVLMAADVFCWLAHVNA